jgi:hypothetical protein
LRLSLSIRVLAAILFASRLHAGFASTETFLPAVGRVAGQGGAQFYTTVWATNLTSEPQTMTFRFLKQGQANGSPASFVDTLQPDETKVYENVVESKLGLSNAIGAARVTSTGEIFVSERIFNQPPGADLGDTEGLFFAGVPGSFSISAGQSASIQGIDQGGSENFRYNFALVETGGGSPTVNVQVLDGTGTLLGQKAYPLQPYEQLQPAVSDVVSGIHTTNARITATVTGGTGSVLIAGAQLANVSQDSSGFEMTFRDELLVGSGNGLTSVVHDATLTGDGTVASPLGVNTSSIVTSLNGLHGAMTLSAGSNVTITPNGSALTIAASGGGGGLTLPFEGSASSGVGDELAAFQVTGSAGAGISGVSTATTTNSPGVVGVSNGTGVAGYGNSNTSVGVFASGGGLGLQATGFTGVLGSVNSSSSTGFGVHGNGAVSGTGVMGESENAIGVVGTSTNGDGVMGSSESSGRGVFGTSSGGYGVYGTVHGASAAVAGVNTGNNFGVYGQSDSGTGVYGTSTGGYAIYGAGTFGSTGGKWFVEPHPTDPTKEIRYVCLEGRESGTYFRGTSRIVNGFATIEVPEDFRMVTSAKGLTVVVSPVGEMASLAVLQRGLERIVVQSSRDVEFDYVVNGVRKAFEEHRPIADNRDFVPRSADDRILTLGLPEESRRRLIANGILNSDGTVNLETAHRLGWDRQESWNRANARKSNP